MNSRERTTIWIIILIALILRLSFLFFGLPHGYWHDEDLNITRTIRIAVTGDLNPHYFTYPSFLIYFLLIVGSLAWCFFKLLGFAPDWNLFWLSYNYDTTILSILGRGFSVLFGIITIWVIFRISKYFLKKYSFFPALLVAISPLCVLESQRFAPDTFMTMFISFSILFALKYYNSNKVKNFYVSAIFAGLAASTKYLGGLVLVAPFLSQLYISKSIKKSIKKILLAILIALIAFFIFSPFIITNPVHFARDFVHNMIHMSEGHLGFENRSIGLFQNFYNLDYALGTLGLIASIVGFLFVPKEKRKSIIIFLSFLVVFLLSTLSWKVVAERYSLIIVPIVAIGCGFLINKIALKNKLIALLISGIILIEPMAYNIGWIRYLNLPITYDIAREWIVENIPSDKTIVAVDNRLFLWDYNELKLNYETIKKTNPSDTILVTTRMAFLEKTHNKKIIYMSPYRTLIRHKKDSQLRKIGKKIANRYIKSIKLQDDIFEDPVEFLRRNNADYYIITTHYSNRLLAHPELYPEASIFYSTIRDSGELIYSIGNPNPPSPTPSLKVLYRPKYCGNRIEIYHLPKSFRSI